MSSVKITRLFHEAGYTSFEICQPASPIEKQLKELKLNAELMTAGTYVSPLASLKLRGLIQRHNVRALFLHSMRDIWLVAPALLGLPEVKLFGFARMFLRDVNKKDFVHTQLYSRLNKMITLSHVQKEQLLNCLPLPAEKYLVIPNGVDITRFQPRPRRDDIRQSWGVKPEHTLFGLIGRLDPQKGSLEFVEAAGEVLSRFPQARFVIVGGNTIGEGDFDRLIHQRIENLGIKDKVILTDFRKDIPDVMNALDVFIMPSYEENFGNVTLEAMASGLPVLGTDAGGTPEILDQGQTGLLCAPRSARALAEGMIQLLTNPALAKTLAQRARAKTVNDYDMHKVFARIERLVHE